MMKLNKKNKGLLLGFFIALLLCYKFAISNTLSYYKQYHSQKELAENNYNSPEVLNQLVRKEKQLNAFLKGYQEAAGDSFQNNLLKQISILSKKYNLKISDFKEPHIFLENNTKTLSYSFSLEGSFNGTLLLINKLENTPSLGFVRHISFTKKRNYKKNTDYLVTEIILQKSESETSNN